MALLTYQELEKLFVNAATLPQAPKSPLRLSALLEMPDASPIEIERIILADPALTAGILKAACSAAFGRLKPVTTVREAVMVLGFRALRVMAIALWTQALICQSKHNSMLDTERFSKNGSFVGHLSSSLYALRPQSINSCRWTAEEVYACGVLHNLAIGLLSMLAPTVFDCVYGFAKDRTISIAQAFQEVYGYELNVLGSQAASAMGLPELFTVMIANIDHPASALDIEVPLLHLHFGHLIALDRGLGIGRWSVPYVPCESMTEKILVSPEIVEENISTARRNLVMFSLKTA